MRRRTARLAFAAVLALSGGAAFAVVGGTPDGRFADHVAMLLIRGGGKAGFCSALVLTPRILLTAAHCLKAPRDMAALVGGGAPRLVAVERAAAHPLYRPDAVARRVESIDLAMVETVEKLAVGAAAVEIATSPPAVGDPVILAGYGAERPGDWGSSGTLRSVALAVRAPLSNVLLWAADPSGGEAGACNGDSGAPIWAGDGRTVIAVVAWAQGRRGRGCGGLTQGPLLAPAHDWIETTRRRFEAH